MAYRLYACSVCDMNSAAAAVVCGAVQMLYTFSFGRLRCQGCTRLSKMVMYMHDASLIS